MKSKLAKVVILLLSALVVLSAATPAPVMRMNIPFPFLAGGQTHSAGVYWVQLNSQSQFADLRPVNSANGERVALNGTGIPRNGLTLTEGFLRFERYGSTYTLRGVGAPGVEDGLGVKPSTIEKELVRANGGTAGFEINVTR